MVDPTVVAWIFLFYLFVPVVVYGLYVLWKLLHRRLGKGDADAGGEAET